jgi:hypothetical protein
VTVGGILRLSGSMMFAEDKWTAVMMVHDLATELPISTNETSLEETYHCEVVNPWTNGLML